MLQVLTASIMAAVWLSLLPLLAHGVPAGFVDEEVAQLVVPGRAVGFSFVPKSNNQSESGHAMLVAAKSGELYVLRDPDRSPDSELILNLSDRMCTDFARGFQSVLPDPAFSQNGWVYLFYSLNKFGNCDEDDVTGPVNRISRFVMDKETYEIDTETEMVLLETPSLLKGVHHGGDLAIGKDGNLYATIGDGGDRRGAVSQNVSNLFGSVLRLTTSGAIPADNPFTAANGYKSARCHMDGVVPNDLTNESFYSNDPVYCEEIYSYGLRNPFRFAFDPNTPDGTVRALINDVGSSEWEETNELVRGANYGWPEREGPCALGSTTKCGEHDFTDPVYFYQHNDEGGAAVGLAFVPNGLWPEEYDNSVLFAEYVFDRIYQLEEDADHSCSTCSPPTPLWKNTTFHEFQRVVHLAFGPYQDTQALYYLARGGGGTSHIRRIRYLGGENMAPVAVLSASRTEGLEGVEVEFDGSGSSDPNGDEITFVWDFGDGSDTLEGPSSVIYEYSSPGGFTASLTVTDALGFSDTAEVDITVGVPPVVTIDSPPEGTEFAVGDVLTLSGTAIDDRGRSMTGESLSWEVRLHHNTHYHPFLDAAPGNEIALQAAPGPEDFLASTNSHLEIIFTATDTNGVRASASRIVMPKKVTLEFDSEPSGISLVLDGFTVSTPIEVVSWENHRLQVDAPDQDPWYWLSWSHNEPQTHFLDVPAAVDRQIPRFLATFKMSPTASPTQREDTLYTPTKPEISAGTKGMSFISTVTTAIFFLVGLHAVLS